MTFRILQQTFLKVSVNSSNTTSGSTNYHCNIKATSLINYLNLILNANLTSGKLSLVFLVTPRSLAVFVVFK